MRLRVTLAALALVGLAACGQTSAADSLLTGKYSGVDSTGGKVDVAVFADGVLVNGGETHLSDPTTTAEFVLEVGAASQGWHCANAEAGRSIQCAVDRSGPAVANVAACGTPLPAAGDATPSVSATPAPCTPAPTPAAHQTIDLLRICTDPTCAS